MNRDVLRSLPRFDHGDAQAVENLAPGSPISGAIHSAAQPFAADHAANGQMAEMSASPDATHDDPPEAGLSPPQMEALLKAVEADLAGLKADCLARTEGLVIAITRTMLPKLAERFLADEVLAQVRTLLPAAPVRICLRAAPDMAAQLERKLIEGSDLCEHLLIEADGAMAFGQVRLTWPMGGADHDFSRALDGMLDDLTRKPHHKEQEQ